MPRKTAYLLCLPVALLAACSAPRPDPNICIPVARASVSAVERDKALEKPIEAKAAQVVLDRYAESCVRRWGYRLAGSPEALDDVAKAALAACAVEIRVVDSLTADTDCPGCTPMAEIRADLAEQARMAVLLSRLGDCRAEGDAAEDLRSPTPKPFRIK